MQRQLGFSVVRLQLQNSTMGWNAERQWSRALKSHDLRRPPKASKVTSIRPLGQKSSITNQRRGGIEVSRSINFSSLRFASRRGRADVAATHKLIARSLWTQKTNGRRKYISMGVARDEKGESDEVEEYKQKLEKNIKTKIKRK
ncbi:predicted protein [Histoplasma mississippiense (nom. inval.)]|uniref:predicted protein n=1 Tax=Ajellomyces capsulatus (strain NAm1 / WU24) TaxID=2059318 RepID=UPI000157BEA1|nr:predicted protein [Histoplasma mississippiense (nom. inval.)]EDN06942.1 predicted protein [Histoplasma mississippiense (nom. inval.)]